MGLRRWLCAFALPLLLLCLGTTSPAFAQRGGTPTPLPPGVKPNQHCASGYFVTGITPGGILECVAVPGGGDMLRSIYDADLDGEVTTAELARALNADPVDCTIGMVVRGIAADGTLTCIEPPAATHIDSGSTLPATPDQGRVFIVTDDPVAGACTSAGGTAVSLCVWDVVAAAWKSPGQVASVYGRIGAVVATAGDYTAAQITNTPAGTIAAATVQAALNELDTEKVNTADAVTTSAADKIPRADGSGIISDTWLSSSVSKLGQTIDATELFDGPTGLPLVGGGGAGDPAYVALGVAGIDTTVIQQRVSGTCSAGFSIRVIAEDGTVTCEEDTVGTAGGGYDAVQTDGSSVAKTASEQLKIAGGTGITTSGAEGTPDVVTVAINDAQVATQSELDTHAANINAHHARDHASTHSAGQADPVSVENLATAGGSGTAPVSGGAGTLTMTNIATQSELDTHAANVNAHHSQSHPLTDNAIHTLTGATDGMVLQATGSATFEMDWSRIRAAANCQALTDGETNEVCRNTGDNQYFACVQSAGLCDTAGEWVPLKILESNITFGTGGANDGSRHDHISADIVNATANKCAHFNASGVLEAATGDCPAGDTGGTVGGTVGSAGFVQYAGPTTGEHDSESALTYDEATNSLTIGRFAATPEAGNLVLVPQAATGGTLMFLEGTNGCSPDATSLANCQSVKILAPATVGTNRTIQLVDSATPIPGTSVSAGGSGISGSAGALVINGDASHTHTGTSISDLAANDIQSGTFADDRVSGAQERDEVTPEWNTVVDCTALSFTACQDAFYAAIQPAVTAADVAAFNAAMPLRVRVILGDQTCTPDTATDYGDFRVCLGIFASGAYSSNRPTPAAKEFVAGVQHGAFEVRLEGSRLNIDATTPGPGAAAHSNQDEPIVGFMVGDGSLAGFTLFEQGQCTGAGAPNACCTGAGAGATCPGNGSIFQFGGISGLKLSGHLTTASTDSRMDNGSGPDWNTAAGGAGRRPITAQFQEAGATNGFASKTTVVGFLINSASQLDLSDWHHTHQHTGGDWDDLGFACTSLSFSELGIGGESISSGNGGWAGPGCDLDFLSMTTEPTSGASDRLGWVAGSPPWNTSGMRVPMSASCASGNCNARYTTATGAITLASQGIAEGFRTANWASAWGGITGELYTESNISVLGPRNADASNGTPFCTAADVPWDCCTGAGTGTCIPADFMVGYGVCAADGSMCTENADCPVNASCTGAGTPWPCCTAGTGNGNCGTAQIANSVCTAAGAPYFCCTGSGTGTCIASQQCQGAGINSQVDSDISGNWVRSMLGFGPNAKSPYNTSVAGPAQGQFKLHTAGGPNLNIQCTGASAPFACCTGSGAGTCSDFKVHSGLTTPPSLDFTGLNAAPVKIPAGYAGQITPQIQVISSADCPGTPAIGVLGQYCVSGSTLYKCDPDNGGTLSNVCDNSADWVSLTGGGGGAPTDATYITRTPIEPLSQETAISTLATGILFGTATTGTLTSLGPTAIAQGDLLYGSGANTLAVLAKNATATRYLSNTGTTNNPAWAQVDLTNGVTGTLGIGNGGTGITSFGTGVATWLGTPSGANLAAALTTALPVSKGGTGLTSGTSGGVPYFSGATALSSSGVLGTNAVVLGGGAGAAPKTSTGITSDGSSKLILGVNATSSGSLQLFGGTSGSATIQTAAIAGTSTITLPNASSTLPIFGQQMTFTGPTTARTVTLPDADFTAIGAATLATECEPFVLLTPADADDHFFDKRPYDRTLTSFNCIAVGGGTIAVTLNECSSTGTTCGTGGAFTEAVTCDSDGAVDDGLTNAAVAGNNWTQVLYAAPTGTVTSLTGTVCWTRAVVP